MSIRKRTWTTTKGEQREAWVVNYTDTRGRRRLKTYKLYKRAKAFSDKTAVAVREGTHIADSDTMTVAEAARLWLQTMGAAGLERTTTDQYKQHVDFHIVGSEAPEEDQVAGIFIGRLKLSQITAPTVRAFEDKLAAHGRSPTMVRYVVRSLGAILTDAQERGNLMHNAVRELRGRRRRGTSARQERRGSKLKIGVDIPTPAEIKAIVGAAERHWRPLLLTAIFTGLRASELRGLRWLDIDLDKAALRVSQRADRYNAIGQPKSEAGERTVPLPPIVVSELREWKLKCPKFEGRLGLVFPTGTGKVEAHPNIVERGLKPTLIRAGVTAPVLDEKGVAARDEDGKPILAAKYTGLHALRHFYASWCINRKSDGGLELPAKVVQARMGHSSITVTLDTYGHLFPSNDSGAELADAERVLLG